MGAVAGHGQAVEGGVWAGGRGAVLDLRQRFGSWMVLCTRGPDRKQRALVTWAFSGRRRRRCPQCSSALLREDGDVGLEHIELGC